MDYRIIQDHNHIVPIPNYVTFSQHVMLLSQQRISDVEAIALKQYLFNTKNITTKRVYKLVIETCHLKDEQLSQLLQGIILQCQKQPGKKDAERLNIKMQYL